MLRVGLTGGIGSGKSTVAASLAGHGAVVVDADALAREVVEPGTPGLADVVERFGTDVLNVDGSLDRSALGRTVFTDDAGRRDLEAVLHPRIAALTAERIATASADAVVVHDVPLLVEKALGAAYHLVVVVGAAEQTRVQRLVRRGLTGQDARARIAAQADDGARRAAADVWLDNDGTTEALAAEVATLWRGRLVPYEANVRTGTPNRGGDVGPWAGPGGPADDATVARLAGRLRYLFGDLAANIKPRDSSGTEGLRREQLLMLEVGVAQPAAVDDAVLRRLREGGFVAVGDAEGGAPDGHRPLPALVLEGCDPGRVVRVEVRATRDG